MFTLQDPLTYVVLYPSTRGWCRPSPFHMIQAQFLVDMSSLICWSQFLFGHLTGEDYHQLGTWLNFNPICFAPVFYMSMLPQSAPTHCTVSPIVCTHSLYLQLSAPTHCISNCLRTYSSSQLCAGLLCLSGNATHPSDHSHLRPLHLSLQLCPHGPCLAPVQQAASNTCHVNLALWISGRLPTPRMSFMHTSHCYCCTTPCPHAYR